MGRTSLALASIMIFMYLVCFFVGAVDNLALSFVIHNVPGVNPGGGTDVHFSYTIDWLFTQFQGPLGFTHLISLLLFLVSVMGFLTLVVGIAIGIISKQNLDTLFAVPIVLLLLSMWVGLQQITIKLWHVAPPLAIIYFVPLLIIGIIIIMENWRSPVT